MTLMTVREVSDYLGLTPYTVNKYVRNNLIPYIPIVDEGAVRFDKDAIDAWLKSRSVEVNHA